MSKVRLTDVNGRHLIVNTDLIYYLEERTSEGLEGVWTVLVMPDNVNIIVNGTLDQTIEKLRWRV